MKTAKFEMSGWIGTFVHELEGEMWCDVFDEFNRFQDVDCLIRQAYMMGTKKDQAAIAPFEAFVSKWKNDEVAKEDFAAFRLKLSIGHFCCLSATDEDGTVTFPAWEENKTGRAKTAPKKTAKKPVKKPAKKPAKTKSARTSKPNHAKRKERDEQEECAS